MAGAHCLHNTVTGVLGAACGTEGSVVLHGHWPLFLGWLP